MTLSFRGTTREDGYTASKSFPYDFPINIPPLLLYPRCRSETPKTKEIGRWRNCGVWNMNNLRVVEKCHCPLRKELSVKDWWNPAYRNTRSKTVSDAGVEEAPEQSMSILTGALESIKFDSGDNSALDERNDTDGLHLDTASRTQEERSFLVHFKGRTQGRILKEGTCIVANKGSNGRLHIYFLFFFFRS